MEIPEPRSPNTIPAHEQPIAYLNNARQVLVGLRLQVNPMSDLLVAAEMLERVCSTLELSPASSRLRWAIEELERMARGAASMSELPAVEGVLQGVVELLKRADS